MAVGRYETLDMLRGVAAVAVVVFHLGSVRLEPNLVPHGYLAVDFFFVLSGFVVAHAYEAPLRKSLSWREFVGKRIVRLYPLAALGAALGLLVLLLKWHSYPAKVDPLPQLLVSGVLNGLMLPTFFGTAVSRYELFPGNAPLWTLFFEMVANMLWAWRGPRMRNTVLGGCALASFAVFTLLVTYFHTGDLGFNAATILGGLARVCFGFPLGVLLWRLHAAGRLPRTQVRPALLGVGLLAVLAAPWRLAVLGIPAWDVVSVLAVLPAMVALGATCAPVGRAGRWLGELSYPVYVLHFPILLIASGLHQSSLSWLDVHVMALGSVVAAVLLAVAADRFYDRPVRRWLSRRRRTAPAVSEAVLAGSLKQTASIAGHSPPNV